MNATLDHRAHAMWLALLIVAVAAAVLTTLVIDSPASFVSAPLVPMPVTP